MPRKTLVTVNPLYWMPLNLDQWLGEIGGGLLPEQKGGLIDLLAKAWKQSPPCTLENDPDVLAAASGLGGRWKRLSKPIMQHFIAVQDNRLCCPWLLDIYKAQMEKYEHRKNANVANAAKRGQHELFSGTNGRTNAGTNGSAIRRTTATQIKEREGVAPKGANTRTAVAEPPDALAPGGARAGSVDGERPVEDRTVPRHDRRPFRLTDIVPAELRPKREAAP